MRVTASATLAATFGWLSEIGIGVMLTVSLAGQQQRNFAGAVVNPSAQLQLGLVDPVGPF